MVPSHQHPLLAVQEVSLRLGERSIREHGERNKAARPESAAGHGLASFRVIRKGIYMYITISLKTSQSLFPAVTLSSPAYSPYKYRYGLPHDRLCNGQQCLSPPSLPQRKKVPTSRSSTIASSPSSTASTFPH